MKCIIFNVVSSGPKGRMSSRTLGAYKIAHFLRTHNWDAEVIDYASSWTLEQLQELVKSRYTLDTKFFGFSKLFDSWPDTMEIFAAWLKQTYPNLILISGSQYHTDYSSNFIDYYINGYGETAILSLLKYLFSIGSHPKFSLTSNAKRKVIEANVFYPATSSDNLMVMYEDRDFIDPQEWLTLEFSRGCKFACAFCDFPFLNTKDDVSRSQEDFEKQVRDAYDRFGVNRYIVADSTFNDRTEKITKFADVVEKLDFDIFFSGYIRADLIISRPRDREELLRMNFLGQFYGIESFNHATTKAIGKGMTPEKIKQGLLDVKKYFQTHGTGRYLGHVSLIIGLPHETLQSAYDGLKWVADYWSDPYSSSSPTPYLILLDDKKTSTISQDYEKFNYSLLDTSFDKSGFRDPTRVLADCGNEYLLWKNEHMDMIQAYNMCEEFNEKVARGHGPFNIASISYRTLTIDQILTGRINVDHAAEEKKFLENYINKKLSI